MDNLAVRQGATLPLTLEYKMPGASTAAITVKKNVADTEPVYSNIANIIDSVANLTIAATDTRTKFTVGVYQYQITITYADGTVEKFPETDIDPDD